MRFRLIPTDDAFFALFNDSAANVADCARRLRDLLADPTNAALHEKVAACEHKGDEIVHTILQRLNTTFVTPFDREDIHALAEELDDVVDDLREVSQRMQIIGITTALPELKEQADLVVQCADEVQQLMARLESMKGALNTLEDISDVVESIVLKHA